MPFQLFHLPQLCSRVGRHGGRERLHPCTGRQPRGLKRLFLHASSLEFALDGGRTPYLLHAPLAPELVEVLDRLR